MITEACPANMGVVPPAAGSTRCWRAVRRPGALLIMDEVLTGFRVTGAGWYGRRRRGRRPGDVRQGDGRRAALRRVRRAGRDHGEARPGRAGLPGGHAVGEPARHRRRAGHAARCTPECTRGWTSPRAAAQAASGGARRRGGPGGCQRRAACSRLPRRTGRCGTSPRPRTVHAAYAAFFHAMLDRGVYLPPSAFEAWFVSAAHDEEALPGRRRSAAPVPPPRPWPDPRRSSA